MLSVYRYIGTFSRSEWSLWFTRYIHNEDYFLEAETAEICRSWTVRKNKENFWVCFGFVLYDVQELKYDSFSEDLWWKLYRKSGQRAINISLGLDIYKMCTILNHMQIFWWYIGWGRVCKCINSSSMTCPTSL